ncbi:MAG: S-layer homology domain-containing protein [Armatimonadota bacterium]|nr:S-layer homology domain-containing protein [Armatimonadota bacterium]
MTRKTAGAVVLALVLALVAPGFTQPFADVPTNHWAYDAIAELAAKGLIEGYPDGTFKGNQPLTRYEMAMVVARIIARIEAIPTPPPPEVRRADLDAVRRDLGAAVGRISVNERNIATLQRLVNEFRAELQALGVRVTALEEELQALRARLDNTRITGTLEWWYTANQTPTLPPDLIFGPRVRIIYTGAVAEDVSVLLRARYISRTAPPPQNLLDFDRGYLQLDRFLGMEGLQLRAGRDVVVLGPIGFLLDEDYYNDNRTGVVLRWQLGGLSFLGVAQYADPNQTNPATLLGGRLAYTLLPGYLVGVSLRSDTDPSGTLQRGLGWGADLRAELLGGVTLTAEYANYRNDTTGQAGNYWYAEVALNLAQLTPWDRAPRIALWYKNLDPYVLPPLPAPRGEFASPDFFGTLDPNADLNAWGLRLDWTLTDALSAWGLGEFGNYKSTGIPYALYELGITWTLAANTSLSLYYTNIAVNNVATNQIVGAYVFTSW